MNTLHRRIFTWEKCLIIFEYVKVCIHSQYRTRTSDIQNTRTAGFSSKYRATTYNVQYLLPIHVHVEEIEIGIF